MIRHLRLLFLVMLVSLATTPQRAAAQPSITDLDTLGLLRGQRVDVAVEGEGLSNVADVLFYDDALSLVEIVSASEEQCVLRIACDPEARNGEHPFRLVSPSGVSPLRTLLVGPYKTIREREPNDSVADAQPIRRGTTVEGVVTQTDADAFKLSLKAGDRLTAEVEALRLGRLLFDAKLDVLDANGEVLLEVDDCASSRLDPVLSLIAPKDGDYVVRVREAAFGGDDDAKYRLHISGAPRPTVAYPAGGKLGSTESVQLLGDAGGPIPFEVDLNQVREPGTTLVYVNDDIAAPLRFRATNADNTLEQEPNNSLAEASQGPKQVVAEFALNGVLSEPGDTDYFQFFAEAGAEFDVQLFGARLGSPIDSVVTVYDPAGKVTVVNDDGIIHDSVFRFVARSTGVYRMRVQDHLDRGGSDFVYRVEFKSVAPGLVLRVPEHSDRQPQRFQSIVVPRGNRCFLPVICGRANFDGPVTLSTGGLPRGVTATSGVIDRGRHIGRLVFEASADCPLGAQLIEIRGRGDSPAGSVLGTLDQNVGLVFGPPRNQAYHAFQTKKIPLVVVEEAPFELEVVDPRGPLVQDGRLDLRVTATRAAGFDDEIEIEIPNLPPWLFQPEDAVVIPEGKSEVVFPLYSEQTAEVRDWELVAIGSAETELGDFHCASEPFRVQVAERFLDVEIASTSTEQGVPATVDVEFDWKRNFTGVALAKLQGLPKNAKVAAQTVTPGTSSIQFTVETSEETPVSVHNTLFLELSLRENGQLVTHFLGRGSSLEVFPAGGKPRDTASRLEILRRRKAAQNRTAVSQRAASSNRKD